MKLIGIYNVSSHDDINLIEMEFNCKPSSLDLMQITQENTSLPKSEWQVPYEEKYLNDVGDTVIGDMYSCDDIDADKTRVCFFMFYVDWSKPLITPYGKISLPKPTNMPVRLSSIIDISVLDT